MKNFFNDLNLMVFGRGRTTDPITSHMAADAVKEMAADHHQIILDCLIKFGPMGKDGIAAHTNLDGNQVARRLKELYRLNLICLTDRLVMSNAGRHEREWSSVRSGS
jgi:transcription initiation factor IIE alpha subunit